MSSYRDIVIAGGGMVGVSLALQLGELLSERVRICLIEGFPFPDPLPGAKPDYHPSFDARSTALSYSTRLIYEKMGVWADLERWLCPIESIHVSNRGRFGSTVMQAPEYGWPALGYVVENAWLGSALVQALYRQDRVELISPAKVQKALPGEGGVSLMLEGSSHSQLQAGLLLVADGANSGLRKQLGVAVQEKPYRQHALIANIAFAGAHENCAYERFTADGPIALLPLMSTVAGEQRSALVWTLSGEEVKEFTSCSDEHFLSALQQRFGYRLGRLLHVGERHSYPLTLVQAVEQVRKSVVVMGNAAHALHPVAGQGYNLALRDVAVLAKELARAEIAGKPLGDLSVLQRYCDKQRSDQILTVGASDVLPSLFMHTDPVLGMARDIGLAGLDMIPGVKRQLVRHAAGVAAMEGAPHG